MMDLPNVSTAIRDMTGVKITNTLGLQAVTIWNGNPYFFLFSDIDTFKTENLLRVLKFYHSNKMSCYHYATTKGYHVISPQLLTFRSWCYKVDKLKNLVDDYRFDAIRISYRNSDSKICYFHQWNYSKNKESKTLDDLMRNKFRVINDDISQLREGLIKPRNTILKHVYYDQLNFKGDNVHKDFSYHLDKIMEKETVQDVMSPIHLGSQDESLDVKHNVAFEL
jgi:hypothetical protein